MTVQGNLSEMGVTDLIQHACMDGRTTCISLRKAGDASPHHIYIEDGKLVHAEKDDRSGEDVIYDVLNWEEGSFTLEPDVPSPAHTIQRGYTVVLLEGMRRIDENNAGIQSETELQVGMEDPTPVSIPVSGHDLNALVKSLATLQGVVNVVIAARDGVVIAHDLEMNPDKDGAIAVFIGMAADQVAGNLYLGAFRWATVVTGKDKTLVIEQPDYFIGLKLSGKASPALVASQAQSLLG